ncbi:MAG: hypothetical protein K6F35_08210 [Lachnospiraceae bacterium]|nr:hypothetical protein [Lachnospiraceae bacterium]
MEFTQEEIWKCYDFSRKMIGNHNPTMIMERRDWEIFRDDFRGKLGEMALRKYVRENFPAAVSSEIDFEVTPRGQWDIVDLIINNKYINVKSIKQRSRFLMIETLRYDADGHYAYRNSNGEPVRIDAYVLVRVTVDPDIRWDDLNYGSAAELLSAKGTRSIEAQILGGISHQEFWQRKHFAPKNMKCDFKNLSAACRNGRIEMQYEGRKTEFLQTDNYILDSNTELHPVREIIS